MHGRSGELCRVKLNRPCSSTFELHSLPVNRTQIVTDFLDEKRQEINQRLAELKPLIDEYNRLEAAATALSGVRGSAPASRTAAAAPAASAAPARRGPGRPRGSKSTTGKRRGRPRGARTRRRQPLPPLRRPPRRPGPPQSPHPVAARDAARAAARVRPRPCST